MRILPVIALLAVSLVAAPVHAQSLFNSTGFGLPLDGLDGRARALGSFGIGLQGASISPTDPSAAARLGLPSGVIAGQPSWTDYSDSGSGQGGSLQGSRFPLIGLAYPAFQGMVLIQMSSFLDQRFSTERAVTVDLGMGPVGATDRFVQEGSVSNISLGYARAFGPSLSAGLTVGRYTGSVVRELLRDFGETLEATGIETYAANGYWDYAGTSVTGAVTADIQSIARVGAALSLSSSLEADASEGSDGSDRSFELPFQFRVGGSVVLAPGLVVSASGRHVGWSSLADDLAAAGDVNSTTGFGAGIEVGGARVLGKRAPLRLGYRSTGLPFGFGGETASEKAFTGGFGFLLNETNGIILAGADVGLERGKRTSGLFSETFWRVTASVRVSGF